MQKCLTHGWAIPCHSTQFLSTQLFLLAQPGSSRNPPHSHAGTLISCPMGRFFDDSPQHCNAWNDLRSDTPAYHVARERWGGDADGTVKERTQEMCGKAFRICFGNVRDLWLVSFLEMMWSNGGVPSMIQGHHLQLWGWSFFRVCSWLAQCCYRLQREFRQDQDFLAFR